MAEVLLRSLVDTHRDQIKSVVSRHCGRTVALLGSVARGEETPDSGLDFLVEFDAVASLFDLVRIEIDLEDLLGRPVDVVSVGGLLPRGRRRAPRRDPALSRSDGKRLNDIQRMGAASADLVGRGRAVVHPRPFSSPPGGAEAPPG